MLEDVRDKFPYTYPDLQMISVCCCLMVYVSSSISTVLKRSPVFVESLLSFTQLHLCSRFPWWIHHRLRHSRWGGAPRTLTGILQRLLLLPAARSQESFHRLVFKNMWNLSFLWTVFLGVELRTVFDLKFRTWRFPLWAGGIRPSWLPVMPQEFWRGCSPSQILMLLLASLPGNVRDTVSNHVTFHTNRQMNQSLSSRQ